ncbi:CRISPR system precrRNA processing endoribonuclease RAMP protein Cas6 [Rhabdothermincola sediminis]|uniref:CRISPR system precrRNA processing endoribonuclease RAMP protein Cas6 n=1 Tax=Rhabdothermincola sediminis TaxID=2751370 RepID=UPI001AA03D71|nr:CRISPR system precrRNA processing endoribonuclease RAMP protein Cas6 [Rhabdothermincola sediminis]
MPTRIVLRVDAGEPFVAHPPFRRLHGLACQLFERHVQPSMHRAQVKPFTVGPLVRRPDGSREWQVTWLPDEAVSPVLGRTVQGRVGEVPVTLIPELVHHRSFRALRAADRSVSFDLQFRSPTWFSRSGVELVLPDPPVMLAGLARRWNEFAPSAVPSEVLGALSRVVQVAAVDLQTVRTNAVREVRFGHGPPALVRLDLDDRGSRAAADRAGFVGAARVVLAAAALRSLDDLLRPACEEWFGALMWFAAFAGVGKATTQGYGWCDVTAADAGPFRRRVLVGRSGERSRRSRPAGGPSVTTEAAV